jgi:hypothetical protein
MLQDSAMAQINTNTPSCQGDYSSYDSNEKIKTMEPVLKDASEKTGVPLDVLEAQMIKESTGVSIDNMKAAGGLMQLGQAEFAEEQGRHPELKNLAWDSPEGQILGAAFRLKDFEDKCGSYDSALAMYNGGENAGGKLNDPNYINIIHDYVQKIDAGQPLPS